MPTKKSKLPLKQRLRGIEDGKNLIVEICLLPPTALSGEANTPIAFPDQLSLSLSLFQQSDAVAAGLDQKIEGKPRPTFLGRPTVGARLDDTVEDATAKALEKLGQPFDFKIEKVFTVLPCVPTPVSIGV
jgi:hypothetical protein